jgi:hypothetical protein
MQEGGSVHIGYVPGKLQLTDALSAWPTWARERKSKEGGHFEQN